MGHRSSTGLLSENSKNLPFLDSFGAFTSLLASLLNCTHLTHTHELYKQNKV